LAIGAAPSGTVGDGDFCGRYEASTISPPPGLLAGWGGTPRGAVSHRKPSTPAAAKIITLTSRPKAAKIEGTISCGETIFRSDMTTSGGLKSRGDSRAVVGVRSLAPRAVSARPDSAVRAQRGA